LSSVVNLRLDAELAKAARAKAQREERTVSAVIRRALRRDIEREGHAPGREVASASRRDAE
jgi:predicted transcriptional regulator